MTLGQGLRLGIGLRLEARAKARARASPHRGGRSSILIPLNCPRYRPEWFREPLWGPVCEQQPSLAPRTLFSFPHSPLPHPLKVLGTRLAAALHIVSRATPFLRKGSGTLQFVPDPMKVGGVLPPKTCMWFAYCATSCTLCSHYQPEQSVAL